MTRPCAFRLWLKEHRVPGRDVEGEDVGRVHLAGSAHRHARRAGLGKASGDVDRVADQRLAPDHTVDLPGRQDVGRHRLRADDRVGLGREQRRTGGGDDGGRQTNEEGDYPRTANGWHGESLIDEPRRSVGWYLDNGLRAN